MMQPCMLHQNMGIMSTKVTSSERLHQLAAPYTVLSSDPPFCCGRTQGLKIRSVTFSSGISHSIQDRGEQVVHLSEQDPQLLYETLERRHRYCNPTRISTSCLVPLAKKQSGTSIKRDTMIVISQTFDYTIHA